MLDTEFPKSIPEVTRQVVEPLLKGESLYAFLGEQAPRILDETEMAGWYSGEGRPGIHPLILMLVLIFQFVEDVPDRLAAEMAVMRLDWKYALRQELTWSGFHYSDLCNFRKRLVANHAWHRVFEQVLSYLQTHGYVQAKGKQRTDSTAVLGQVARLSRLELVWESLRLAVEAVVSADAVWSLQQLPPSFIAEHSRKRMDYRLKPAAVKTALQKAGEEATWLLKAIEQSAVDWQTDEALHVLRRVVSEQFETNAAGKLQARTDTDACGDVLVSPHETEARYGKKGDKGWLGYKVQVTESVDPDGGFITDVAVTATALTDTEALAPIQQRLVARDLAPTQHYVDRGYMSAENIVASTEQGIDLRGRVLSDTSAHPAAFQHAAFQLDPLQRQATCPAGNVSVSWRTYPEPKKGVSAEIRFGTQCRTCPFFGEGQCTTNPLGRFLYLNPHSELLAARRRAAQTPEFKHEMMQRQGIEATMAEWVGVHGGRRARYRGTLKLSLQASLIASAINLKRLARRLARATTPHPFFLPLVRPRFISSSGFFNRHT